MKPTIKINGLTYVALTSYPSKADAKRYAKDARKHHFYTSVREVS